MGATSSGGPVSGNWCGISTFGPDWTPPAACRQPESCRLPASPWGNPPSRLQRGQGGGGDLPSPRQRRAAMCRRWGRRRQGASPWIETVRVTRHAELQQEISQTARLAAQLEINRFDRMLIPKALREALALQPGKRIEVELEGAPCTWGPPGTCRPPGTASSCPCTLGTSSPATFWKSCAKSA